MQVWRAGLGTLGITLLFAGCSSGSGTPTQSSGPIPIDGLAKAYGDAVCPNIKSCCEAAGAAYSEQSCRAKLEALMQPALTLVDQGKVKYDPSQAGACVSQISSAAASCFESGGDIAACEAVLQGTVPAGGACTSDEECMGPAGAHTSCDQSKCVVEKRGVAGDDCLWTCSEKGSTTWCSGVGSADTGARCFTNDGLYCDSTSTKCKARVAVGAQGCDYGSESCVDGAYCDSGACAAQLAVGADCTSDYECVETAYCDQKCVAKKPLGAACTDDFAGNECIDGSCDANKCSKASSAGFIQFYCG